MFKIVLRLCGLLLAAGGVVALWFGFEAMDEIRGLDNEILTAKGQMSGGRMSKEAGEKRIAESQQEIERKTPQRDRWFAAALAAMVVGLAAVWVPSSGKRKRGQPQPPDPAPGDGP